MSLWGYGKSTTPKMAALKPYIADALAGGNVTALAVPIMLAGVSPEHFSSFYVRPSIVSELKRCGYKTYWISTQSANRQYDVNVTSIAREADHMIMLNNHNLLDLNELEGEHHYDDPLVGAYRQLGASNEKRAIFVHMLGSHFRYDMRYPKSFSTVTMQENLTESYDTSIRYIDRVLGKLYDALPHEDLLFLYASDHGEVFGLDVCGHGFSPSFKNEYRNAFFVWSSKPPRTAILQEAIGGKTVHMQSLPTMIRYLVGIDERLGVLSESTLVLESSETRVVNYSELREYSY
jgi:glucan phosphoethanolaminetransferase (alkaline phosphatase superfamily)